MNQWLINMLMTWGHVLVLVGIICIVYWICCAVEEWTYNIQSQAKLLKKLNKECKK